MIKKFEEIRNLHKLNKKDFAQSIKLSSDQYSKMNKMPAERNIQIEDVSNLALEYNINLNWLLLDLGEMNSIDNNFDSALKQLINSTNQQFNDDSFVKKLLIDNLLTSIDTKMNIKEGLNQRPLWMLRKILKDVTIEFDMENSKNDLLNQIIIAKDPFEKTNQILSYKIQKLTDEECFFIIENKKLFVKMLEKKVNKLDLIAWDFIDKIKNYFKSN